MTRLGQISTPTKRLRFLLRRQPTEEQRQRLMEVTQVSFLPMEAIGESGELRLSEIREKEDVSSGYTLFFDGDVVVAKITPCFENGKGALMQGLLNGVGFGTTELHVLSPGPEVDGRFLYYVSERAFSQTGRSRNDWCGWTEARTRGLRERFPVDTPSLG